MSFNIPNIFLAGTKAIAEDVNENFNVIKEEINLQKDNFTALKENFETVSEYVNGDMREELVNLIKSCHALFCANSGHTNENGEADLLAIDTVNENRIVFKVGDGTEGALELVSLTNAEGERATRTHFEAINMANSADGEYIVCAKISGSPYATKGKIFRCKQEPSMNVGDIWFDTSKIPFKAWHHNGINKYEFEDVPIGSAKVQNGNLVSVTTYPYNQNGFDINTDTILESNSNIMQSILHYSKPDYNSSTEKATGVSHSAEKDGFLMVKTVLGGQDSATLKIGNITFAYGTANAYDGQTFIYPIAKGTRYEASDKITLYFLSHIS